MQVNPTGPGKTSGPRPQRSTGVPQKAASPGRPEPAREKEVPRDNLEISGAARDLASRVDYDRPESSTLATDRTQQVLQRIASGFYAQAEVQDRVVRRIAEELHVDVAGS